MSTGPRFELYNESQLQDVIDDMAGQCAGLLDDTPTVLLGMLRRGAPLADRLHQALQRRDLNTPFVRIDVKVKRYADTLELLHPNTALEAPSGAELAGKRVIVVDDVLYQGYSLFRVLEWLATQNVASAHAAVLVDRQRYKMPVRADVVGITLKIAPSDVIECNVPPYEDKFAVDVWRPEGKSP